MEPEIIVLFVMFYVLLEEWVKIQGKEEERTLISLTVYG